MGRDDPLHANECVDTDGIELPVLLHHDDPAQVEIPVAGLQLWAAAFRGVPGKRVVVVRQERRDPSRLLAFHIQIDPQQAARAQTIDGSLGERHLAVGAVRVVQEGSDTGRVGLGPAPDPGRRRARFGLAHWGSHLAPSSETGYIKTLVGSEGSFPAELSLNWVLRCTPFARRNL